MKIKCYCGFDGAGKSTLSKKNKDYFQASISYNVRLEAYKQLNLDIQKVDYPQFKVETFEHNYHFKNGRQVMVDIAQAEKKKYKYYWIDKLLVDLYSVLDKDIDISIDDVRFIEDAEEILLLKMMYDNVEIEFYYADYKNSDNVFQDETNLLARMIKEQGYRHGDNITEYIYSLLKN